CKRRWAIPASKAKSATPPAAGWTAIAQTSSTGTNPHAAATSRRYRSRCCLWRSCGGALELFGECRSVDAKGGASSPIAVIARSGLSEAMRRRSQLIRERGEMDSFVWRELLSAFERELMRRWPSFSRVRSDSDSRYWSCIVRKDLVLFVYVQSMRDDQF